MMHPRDAVMALSAALLLCACVHPPARTSSLERPGNAAAVRAEAVVRKFWDAFNRAAWTELDALVTPTYQHHPPGKSLTLAHLKAGGAWVHRGLAGYVLTIDSLVATDASVAIRWTARGQHVGPFFGETPSQRTLVVQGMHFHSIVDGRIAEDWEVIDFDGFKAQLRVP